MRATVLTLLLVSTPALATPGNAGVPDRLADLEARVATLEADRDTCRADLDALTEASEVQSDAIQAYEALLDEALARIPAHEPDWTDLNDRVDALEVQVTGLAVDLGSVLDCMAAWLRGDEGACGFAGTDPNGQ